MDALREKSGPQKRRLAAALRSLSAEVVDSEGFGRMYGEISEAIEGFTERLRGEPRRMRHVGFRERDASAGGREFDFGMMDLSPVSGLGNPLAPPMRVEYRDKNRVRGTVTFPVTFGARNGYVHNGYLAAAMDEVFGAILTKMGEPIMTGILDIRFLRPCPVEKELEIEGRVRRMSGKFVFTEAGARTEARAVADAEAVFFVVGEEQYKHFAKERNDKLGIR
jgi:acyl-coenzyme A thioesterase PaaI-like protein